MPRARSIESVRRKYSPKKQLTVYSPKRDSTSLSASVESESQTESAHETTTQSPTKATVRRTHAFRRSSRYRKAFRQLSPRVQLPLYNNDTLASLYTTDAVGSEPIGASVTSVTGDECMSIHKSENPTQQPGAEVCSLEAVVVSFSDEDDDCGSSDIGPEPVILQAHTTEKVMPPEVDICIDVGPEPVELMDAVVGITEDKVSESRMTGSEKRPSLLKRMLSKSSTLLKKTSSKRNRSEAATTRATPVRRTRARVPVKRMVRRPRKIVVMGDMFSGKSSLISAYCYDRFSTNYVPTLLNILPTDAKVFGETIELIVVDVGGRDDYSKVRKCAYHKIDTIILCYSADSPNSLQRTMDYWVPEIQRYAPKVPFILVATKKDIRDDVLHESATFCGETGEIVSTMSGKKVAETIGAQKFLECSALYRDNTRNVFETAAKVALRKSRRKRK